MLRSLLPQAVKAIKNQQISKTFKLSHTFYSFASFSSSSSKMLCRFDENSVLLPKDSNQAQGLAKYAIDFVNGSLGTPLEAAVSKKVIEFHTDCVFCGLSALALKTNAPTVLREEALTYPDKNGATVLASAEKCSPEKAILANASAMREWDSNGTLFGYRASMPSHQAGEFGHNDFYGVPIAAAQVNSKIDGKTAVKAMVCIDEIRGRLAEAFSLKSYKIDHVLFGGIASAAVYGALLGASIEEIECAIGMTVAHYIPYRAIRAGKQLSDSKGSSAALTTEAAIMSMKRAMKGFVGPKDIFRNPEALFRLNEPTSGDSPFDLILSHSGSDFAVSGMHFKLGLYEHQSAGALEGLLSLLVNHGDSIFPSSISGVKEVKIVAYEPAMGIIGDPAKRDPKTRQSADHSMVYMVSTLLRKAFELEDKSALSDVDSAWCTVYLDPYDYHQAAIHNESTRLLMEKIVFEHGGKEYDSRYPDGIPTSVCITLKDGRKFESGMVMYPTGHARNTTANFDRIFANKLKWMGKLALSDEDAKSLLTRLANIENATNAELQTIYNAKLLEKEPLE